MLPFTADEVPASLVRRVMSQYKASAKKRKLDFELPFETFGELILQDCGYCGAGPSNLKKYKGMELPYNGIDRLDSSRGYLPDNVIPCCSFCNSVKSSMPFEDWADFLNGVVRLFGGSPPYPEIESPERAGKSFYFRQRKRRS